LIVRIITARALAPLKETDVSFPVGSLLTLEGEIQLLREGDEGRPTLCLPKGSQLIVLSEPEACATPGMELLQVQTSEGPRHILLIDGKVLYRRAT
jgi:hypothetical protein